MKIESGAPRIRFCADGARRVAVIEPAGRVGLVRRLVLRKPNVPVDAKHRSLRIADDLGCESGKPSVELFDQLSHRGARIVLVNIAMRLEPRLFVVPGELPEEGQRALAECHGEIIVTRSET